jgi:hypothetical protein
MSILQEAVERLGVRELTEGLGAALLGCTAPDRRVLTQQPRQETHFFHLTEDGMGDGLRGLRHAHPHLVEDPAALDWKTRAFLFGYVSHLAADEAWIVDVYRPFFEDGAYLGKDPTRNILDRALQYDLERRVLEDKERLARWHKALAEGPPKTVPESFLPSEVMTKWHDFVLGRVLTRDGGWHEFYRFIARFKDDPGLDPAEVESFLADPDIMFQRVFAVVPETILRDHRERSIVATIEMAREFIAP